MEFAYPKRMKLIVMNPRVWVDHPVREHEIPPNVSNDSIATRLAEIYRVHPKASVYFDCGTGAFFIDRAKDLRDQVLNIRGNAFERMNGGG